MASYEVNQSLTNRKNQLVKHLLLFHLIIVPSDLDSFAASLPHTDYLVTQLERYVAACLDLFFPCLVCIVELDVTRIHQY